MNVTPKSPAFISWFVGAKQKAESTRNIFLTYKDGIRYIKIIENHKGPSGMSVFAFIDKTNGDVLKPATWKTPAKHSRGNIFDGHYGLKHVDAYGPAYLR